MVKRWGFQSFHFSIKGTIFVNTSKLWGLRPRNLVVSESGRQLGYLNLILLLKVAYSVLLKSLEDTEKLSRSQYLQLYPADPQPPLFNGLPKIHKPSIPLRPIVSTVDSVTYDVAKHLASLQSPLVGDTQHHVKDSDAFVEFVRDLHLTDNKTMVSFDVTSLFT